MGVVVHRVPSMDRHDALVALGPVIRGVTPHFEYLDGDCARTLHQHSSEFEVPVSLDLFTSETTEQALARADGERGNKG